MSHEDFKKRVSSEQRRLKQILTPAEAYRAVALHRVTRGLDLPERECPLSEQDCCQSEACKKPRKVAAAFARLDKKKVAK